MRKHTYGFCCCADIRLVQSLCFCSWVLLIVVSCCFLLLAFKCPVSTLLVWCNKNLGKNTYTLVWFSFTVSSVSKAPSTTCRGSYSGVATPLSSWSLQASEWQWLRCRWVCWSKCTHRASPVLKLFLLPPRDNHHLDILLYRYVSLPQGWGFFLKSGF